MAPAAPRPTPLLPIAKPLPNPPARPFTSVQKGVTVNHMVHSNTAAVFRALGDPSRLEIVTRLAAGPRSPTELVAPLGMSLQAVRKHLAVLEGAGLVASVKR